MAEIKIATDANFEELVLKSERPVVVDFWAAWCGPCKMVAPEMEKLAAKYDGTVDVVKVDVDANPGLSQAFNILSIPMIAFFKPGAQPQGVVGFRPLEQLEQTVQPGRVRAGRRRLTPRRSRLARTRPRSSTGVVRFPGAISRAGRAAGGPTRTRRPPGRRRGRRASSGREARPSPRPRDDGATSGVRTAAAATAGSSANSADGPSGADRRERSAATRPGDARRRVASVASTPSSWPAASAEERRAASSARRGEDRLEVGARAPRSGRSSRRGRTAGGRRA